MMTVVDLFSGIGGFSLGLESTGGFRTVLFCEVDPWCRKVLAKHWPGVPIHDDVLTLDAASVARHHPGPVDVLCGGFPCKQTSLAAATHDRRDGLAGPDSGLFAEMVRVIEVCRPRWAIIENPLGVAQWAAEITGSLEGIGYTVSRSELAAADFGSPHSRRRLFFVANLDGARLAVARPRRSSEATSSPWRTAPGDIWRAVAPASWRMGDGFSGRLDRLRALGNAVMPQKAEVIGRAILEAEG